MFLFWVNLLAFYAHGSVWTIPIYRVCQLYDIALFYACPLITSLVACKTTSSQHVVITGCCP